MTKSKRIVACFDSFKDSLSAQEIGSIVLSSLVKHAPYIHQEDGLIHHHASSSTQHLSQNLSASSSFDLINVPLSDGGEGFLHAFQLTHNTSEMKTFVVSHVLESSRINNAVIDASFMILSVPAQEMVETNEKHSVNDSKQIAIVESAKCIGLELVPNDKRNPMHTSTFALGELLKHIIFDLKIHHLCIGLGGSATSDAGLGLLQALGLKIWCYNEETKERFAPDVFYGRHLPMLVDIDASELIESLPDDIHIEVACDVTNPFLGPLGAVNIFSKQKGAVDQCMRDSLESGMIRLNNLYKEKFGLDLSMVPGTGAAGGISGSMFAILSQKGENAVLMKKGIEIIADSANIREKIENAALVLTGEGCFDSQSSSGKVVSLVQEMAHEYNVPLVIICGQSKVDDLGKYAFNTRVLPLVPDHFTLDQSMNNTRECLDQLIQRNTHIFRFKPYGPTRILSFSTPKRYRIDLETPLKDRWSQVIRDYLPYLHIYRSYLLNNMKTEFGSVKFASAMQSIAGWASKNIYTPSWFVGELEGIASITQPSCGLGYNELLTLNMGYNWLAHCTSIVCLDHKTEQPPYHFRNMDWDLELSDELREMTIDVEFYRNNKPVYVMTTWVCFIGATTGMRLRNELPTAATTDHQTGYSISINYRKTDEPVGIVKNFVSGVCSFWPIEMLLRTVLEENESYEEALTRLSTEYIMAPCYLTICGTSSKQGAILTRRRHCDENRLQLHPTRSPFIIQTNIDHWKNEVDKEWAGNDALLHSAVDRRVTATAYLNHARQLSLENGYEENEFAIECGFGCLANYPNMNDETVYMNVMRPGTKMYLSRVAHHPDRP